MLNELPSNEKKVIYTITDEDLIMQAQFINWNDQDWDFDGFFECDDAISHLN